MQAVAACERLALAQIPAFAGMTASAYFALSKSPVIFSIYSAT